MPQEYKNIVFVCTGNSCRSVFAEYYLRKCSAEAGHYDKIISSAGIAASPQFKVPGVVLRLLQIEGIKYIDHTPRTVTTQIAQEADALFCMENHHVLTLRMKFPEIKDKIIHLCEFARGIRKDIIDPIGQTDAFYEICFKEIKNCIEALLKKI